MLTKNFFHVAVALFASVTVLSAGCTRSVGRVQHAGETVAVVSTTGNVYLDASVDGTVARTAGGCLGLRMAGYDEPVPVVWPMGSTLGRDGQFIVVPKLGEVDLGETVSGGGGYFEDNVSSDFPDFPAGCLTQGIVVTLDTAND